MPGQHYDVLIIGGGMVGASLACALAQQALRIAVVESVPFESGEPPGYDERTLALAYGTRRVFEGMGLWRAMSPFATPIHKIHVSDRGRFGVTRLDAADEGVEALGYVAAIRDLGRVLTERLAATAIDYHCPATVSALRVDDEVARVTVRQGERQAEFTARLVVAADGTRSSVRDMLGIKTVRWDYGQTAVIANVTPERPHGHMAYERFTDTGPLALLPMSEDRCALVWTVHSEQAADVMALSDAAFLRRLQNRFGYRVGRFLRAGARHAYPLTLTRAEVHTRERVALIGNAAHTLHPVAGQGFNLGLRDVAVIAEVLADAVSRGEDPGGPAVLARYADWRRHDQRRVIAFTDALARLFANPLPPVALARDLGLVAVDVIAPLKHALTRQTMGLSGRLPRLARGLPLSQPAGHWGFKTSSSENQP